MDKIEREEETREKFFKEHKIECSCRPGFVVCTNCHEYYNDKPTFLERHKILIIETGGTVGLDVQNPDKTLVLEGVLQKANVAPNGRIYGESDLMAMRKKAGLEGSRLMKMIHKYRGR